MLESGESSTASDTALNWYAVLDTGYSGYWTLVTAVGSTGYRLNTGHWILDTGYIEPPTKKNELCGGTRRIYEEHIYAKIHLGMCTYHDVQASKPQIISARITHQLPSSSHHHTRELLQERSAPGENRGPVLLSRTAAIRRGCWPCWW